MGKFVQGTTHTEYLKMGEDDTRRDKRKCIHFKQSDKSCKLWKVKCVGSSQCTDYDDEKEAKPVPALSQAISAQRDELWARAEKEFPIGSTVLHTRFSLGRVEYIRNGKIGVHFFQDNNDEEFDIENCMKYNVLSTWVPWK